MKGEDAAFVVKDCIVFEHHNFGILEYRCASIRKKVRENFSRSTYLSANCEYLLCSRCSV